MENQGCICCGESLTNKSSALSRHEGLCAGCSSFLDGLYAFNQSEADKLLLLPELPVIPHTTADHRHAA